MPLNSSMASQFQRNFACQVLRYYWPSRRVVFAALKFVMRYRSKILEVCRHCAYLRYFSNIIAALLSSPAKYS